MLSYGTYISTGFAVVVFDDDGAGGGGGGGKREVAEVMVML